MFFPVRLGAGKDTITLFLNSLQPSKRNISNAKVTQGCCFFNREREGERGLPAMSALGKECGGWEGIMKKKRNQGCLLLPFHFSSHHPALYDESSWNTWSFQTDMLSHILALVHITIPSHWSINSYTFCASQFEHPPSNKPLLTLQDWVKQPVSLRSLCIRIASSLAGMPTWTISLSKVETVSYPPLYLCT